LTFFFVGEVGAVLTDADADGEGAGLGAMAVAPFAVKP
jgi:hypothetical protein